MSLLKACNGGDTTPPGIDLTQGLVAHYLLNNNADDSHGVYDGTPSGGVDFQGDIANFDGIDDYINIIPSATMATLPSMSLSFWFRPDNVTPLQLLFNGRNDYYLTTGSVLKGFIAINAGFLYVSFRNSDATDTHTVSNYPLVAGEQYHVVYTFDNTTLTQNVYVNGVLQAGYTHVGSGDYTLDDCVCDIGRHYYHGPNEVSTAFYNGYISNFRLYNEAKDQAFIDALFAEGYYPKPLPLPTTVGLIAHYPLTGTAEDTTGNYDGTENSATYKDDVEFGSLYDGGGSITVNATAVGLATWCCYWLNSGTGWVFTKTTTIPSTLTTNDYRNLRLYSLTPSTILQDEIEEYEKNFRPIAIDDGLVAYYPLTNNSQDNYYKEYDGVDTAMTYDGESGVFNGTTSKIATATNCFGITSEFTISFWVKRKDIVQDTSLHTIYAHGRTIATATTTDAGNTFISLQDDGTLLFWIHKNSTNARARISNTTPILDTDWHLCTVTWDGTTSINSMSVFIDGALDNNVADEVPTFTLFDTTLRTASIGTDAYRATYFADLYLAKMRFYNKATTAEQVEAIYNTEKGDFI